MEYDAGDRLWRPHWPCRRSIQIACALESCAGFLGRGSNALSPRPALIDLGNVAVLGLGQENQRDEETHRCDRHRIPQSRIDLAVAATMANAVAGRKPPNQPLPIW